MQPDDPVAVPAPSVEGDLYEAIGDALREVTDQDIIGWFQNAGLYAAHG
jgi:hypothetical protein